MVLVFILTRKHMQLPVPVPAPAPTFAHQTKCLRIMNDMRKKQGRPPLKMATPDEIKCAYRVAKANSAAGVPHTNVCGMAQCECPGFSNAGGEGLQRCIDAYFQEGPTSGLSHYNLVRDAQVSVACGWFKQPDGTFYYSHQLK